MNTISQKVFTPAMTHRHKCWYHSLGCCNSHEFGICEGGWKEYFFTCFFLPFLQKAGYYLLQQNNANQHHTHATTCALQDVWQPPWLVYLSDLSCNGHDKKMMYLQIWLQINSLKGMEYCIIGCYSTFAKLYSFY